MATEVTCGQCQGRLLVETLGVIVACPHCGVHLSIPAPEPVPVSAAESAVSLAPPPVMEVPPPMMEVPPLEPVPYVSPEIARAALADFTSHVSAAASATVQTPPTVEAPRADLDSSNLFDGSDMESASGASANPAEIGWHSAPNLYLATQDQPTNAEAAAVAPPPPVFGAPTSSVTASTEPVATFPSFGEPAAPASPPVEKTLYFSASQQFSLGPAAGEPLSPPAQPNFVFAAPAATAKSEPQPPTPAPATPPPSFQFSAPAPAPAPAASSSTASAFAGFAATPQAPDRTVLPTTTVAEEAKHFEENAAASQLKFMTLLLIVVGSYASAVTIVLVYMFFFGRTSALESLPDLKPPMTKNGDISWQYNPAQNEVAPGHVLSLGQSRRFGNVLVTPVKVTRGVVKFEHYSGKPEAEGFGRGPSEPLLKLWLKFENVSRDQTFAPLDSLMLYTRDVKNLGESVRANSFVATEANRRKGKSLFFIFEMPIHSEFRMVGQNLNRDLAPGESINAFVPSDEEARKLKGDLVWRVQFRKGYNRTTFRGVTTLIDVRFNSSDITDDRSTT